MYFRAPTFFPQTFWPEFTKQGLSSDQGLRSNLPLFRQTFFCYLQTWFVNNKRRFGETKGGLSSNPVWAQTLLCEFGPICLGVMRGGGGGTREMLASFLVRGYEKKQISTSFCKIIACSQPRLWGPFERGFVVHKKYCTTWFAKDRGDREWIFRMLNLSFKELKKKHHCYKHHHPFTFFLYFILPWECAHWVSQTLFISTLNK